MIRVANLLLLQSSIALPDLARARERAHEIEAVDV